MLSSPPRLIRRVCRTSCCRKTCDSGFLSAKPYHWGINTCNPFITDIYTNSIRRGGGARVKVWPARSERFVKDPSVPRDCLLSCRSRISSAAFTCTNCHIGWLFAFILSKLANSTPALVLTSVSLQQKLQTVTKSVSKSNLHMRVLLRIERTSVVKCVAEDKAPFLVERHFFLSFNRNKF